MDYETDITLEIDNGAILKYVRDNYDPADIWPTDEDKLRQWAADMGLYVSREDGGEAI